MSLNPCDYDNHSSSSLDIISLSSARCDNDTHNSSSLDASYFSSARRDDGNDISPLSSSSLAHGDGDNDDTISTDVPFLPSNVKVERSGCRNRSLVDVPFSSSNRCDDDNYNSSSLDNPSSSSAHRDNDTHNSSSLDASYFSSARRDDGNDMSPLPSSSSAHRDGNNDDTISKDVH